MNTLIVGGSGHVSGAVARAALAAGHKVWAVTRGKRPMMPGIQPVTADRRAPGSMETAITGLGMTWDLVIDCICMDVPEIRQDIELFRTRARQFVFISTDFVYNHSRRRFPQDEVDAQYVLDVPTGFDYGKKKRLCELELAAADTGTMAWTVVRPCHIYGPTSELGCIPAHARDAELIQKLRAGQPLKLVGGGYFLQQPILADDLAATIISVGGNKGVAGKIFNTAGPDIVESWQYYRIIADVLGVGLTVEELPVRPYLAEYPDAAAFLCHRIYDRARLKASGLSVPSTSIADGLRLHVQGLIKRKGL